MRKSQREIAIGEEKKHICENYRNIWKDLEYFNHTKIMFYSHKNSNNNKNENARRWQSNQHTFAIRNFKWLNENKIYNIKYTNLRCVVPIYTLYANKFKINAFIRKDRNANEMNKKKNKRRDWQNSLCKN